MRYDVHLRRCGRKRRFVGSLLCSDTGDIHQPRVDGRLEIVMDVFVETPKEALSTSGGIIKLSSLLPHRFMDHHMLSLPLELHTRLLTFSIS